MLVRLDSRASTDSPFLGTDSDKVKGQSDTFLTAGSVLYMCRYDTQILAQKLSIATCLIEGFVLKNVPQGSTLGPLLFIVYIYDMMNITKENKMIVYADDTTVLVKGRNLIETKQHCNDILQRFYDYFCLNKLSVNPSKTKYIIYKPKFYGNKNKKLLSDTTNTKLKKNNNNNI